uniref:DNA ligase 1-like n=1 Tax=Saccoglossus kowalevskii TaxID=10224 RepID=A0ABM0ME41_SACKO|nr:PREDICTED: DNA ligase 1-like [Saccoglossus kowalevskii]
MDTCMTFKQAYRELYDWCQTKGYIYNGLPPCVQVSRQRKRKRGESPEDSQLHSGYHNGNDRYSTDSESEENITNVSGYVDELENDRTYRDTENLDDSESETHENFSDTENADGAEFETHKNYSDTENADGAEFETHENCSDSENTDETEFETHENFSDTENADGAEFETHENCSDSKNVYKTESEKCENYSHTENAGEIYCENSNEEEKPVTKNFIQNGRLIAMDIHNYGVHQAERQSKEERGVKKNSNSNRRKSFMFFNKRNLRKTKWLIADHKRSSKTKKKKKIQHEELSMPRYKDSVHDQSRTNTCKAIMQIKNKKTSKMYVPKEKKSISSAGKHFFTHSKKKKSDHQHYY